MAPHSSTLAWKIPRMEKPGGLQSMGLLRVEHDWATSLSLFTFMHWRGKWQPTPVFLPGESQGRGSLVGCRLRGCTESDTTDATAAAVAAARRATRGNSVFIFTALLGLHLRPDDLRWDSHLTGLGFPGGASGKEPACQCRRHKRRGFHPCVGKTPQRRAWQPTPVFLPGESHRQTDRQSTGLQRAGLNWSDQAHILASLK